MSETYDGNAVTRALFEVLAPMLGEEAKHVSELTLHLGIYDPPRVTIRRHITSLSDVAVRMTSKTFTIVEVPKEQLRREAGSE